MLPGPGLSWREREVDEQPQIPAPQDVSVRLALFDLGAWCTEADEPETG